MPLPFTDTFQDVRPQTTHVNHNLKARFEESGGVGDLPCSDGPKNGQVRRKLIQCNARYCSQSCQAFRRASRELEMSRCSSHFTLRSLAIKPYRPPLQHALNDDDPDSEMKFCERFLGIHDAYPGITSTILWADYEKFQTNERV